VENIDSVQHFIHFELSIGKFIKIS